jgi:mono/diheme cytochrome c family protein
MKTNIQMHLALAASLLAGTMALAQVSPSSNPAAPQKPSKKVNQTKQPDVGERKFQANCGRCHTFPEQLSPSLTGTVVRHMRVRASLSAQDEKDILRFLAP